MHKSAKRPWKVFIAIILAMLLGTWAGQTGALFGITLYSVMDLFGTIFLNALTLVVVPLVSSSIITGVARMGNEGSFGRLGGKTFLFYVGTSLLAVLIGLFFVNLISPGTSHLAPPPGMAEEGLQALQHHLSNQGTGSTLVSVLLQIIPSNVVDAFSHGQMLSLIFFSLLFGYAISKIEAHPSSILQGFWQGVFQTMIQVTHIVMKFLPYGVF